MDGGWEGEAARGLSVGHILVLAPVPVPTLWPHGPKPSLCHQTRRAHITGGRDQEPRAPG